MGVTTYNPKTGTTEHNDMPKAKPAPKRKVTFRPSEPPKPAIPAVSRPHIPVPTIQQAPVTSRPVPSKPMLTMPEIQKTDEIAKPIPSRLSLKKLEAGMNTELKQLSKEHSSAVLEEALKLRRKQESKDRALTPRMRHFTREHSGKLGSLREWSSRWDGPLEGGEVGLCHFKPHTCVPECGMYNDAELKALFDREVRAALDKTQS